MRHKQNFATKWVKGIKSLFINTPRLCSYYNRNVITKTNFKVAK